MKSGKYWWRIVSVNNETGESIATPEREFSIVDNLKAPEIFYPVDKVVVKGNAEIKFSWNKVDGADLYKVMVYDCDTSEIVYDNNVYDSEIKFKMDDGSKWMDRHFFKFTVQGKSLAVPGVASRRSGDTAEVKFQMLRLRPVEILEPENNSEVNGIDAVSKKLFSKWYAVDDVSYAQLVLYKISGKSRKAVLKIPSDEDFAKGITVAPEKVLLDVPDGLRDGRYEIVVFAKTHDGIDISNTAEKYRSRFTIKPIIPLAAAQRLSVFPEVFDRSFIEKNENRKFISFSWDKVDGATDYIFRISNVKNRKKIIVERILDTNKTIIDFDHMEDKLKMDLMNGDYVWTVEAVRRFDSDGDGKLDRILQPATQSRSMFKTSILLPGSGRATGAENPYGR